MNEDIMENKEDIGSDRAQSAQPMQPIWSVQPTIVPDFKKVCVRIGLMMIVVFATRCICSVALVLARPIYIGWNEVGKTLLQTVASIVFLNVIPITAGLYILKFPLKIEARQMYAKPKYFGRALGMFPAGYGAAMTMSLLTMLIGRLFVGTPIEDSFNAVEDLFTSSNMTSALVLFFHTVVLAPLFEEFWFRGLVLQSLRPYGNGFAIFVSALLFGLTHANLAQFFYTTTIGIILGYVAVQTGSVVTTTVMHAMFNGIAGITSLLLANFDVQQYMLDLTTGTDIEKPPIVIVYIVWASLVLTMAFVGFIMAIVKLVHIRRYRVPKVQTEMSSKRRWGIFLSRPTVVIMLLMALDTMTIAFVTEQLKDLFVNIFYG